MFSIDTAAISRCSSLERVQESHSRIVSTNNRVLCAYTVSSQLPHSRPLTISLLYLPLPLSLALAFIFLSFYHYPTRSSPFYFFYSASFPSSLSLSHPSCLPFLFIFLCIPFFVYFFSFPSFFTSFIALRYVCLFFLFLLLSFNFFLLFFLLHPYFSIPFHPSLFHPLSLSLSLSLVLYESIP
ncbi:unnamed protein product [Acanthosepion pharaonis]|uniref:Uncharacterized protein n=1 Tax=Acanthosepion pharaonis TaxID=158019 RepID=A0A812EL19_ACAPH|nr:unnamed protein product [Sepia pharaonis]